MTSNMLIFNVHYNVKNAVELFNLSFTLQLSLLDKKIDDTPTSLSLALRLETEGNS